MATASFGFDVILIEEDNSKAGRKPDAIVNGIVMDFKETEAETEQTIGKNTLGKRYQDGMKKIHSSGVALYVHQFSNEYIFKNMEGKTSPSNNGLALFFHESTGLLQLIDMKKIRAAHNRQSRMAQRPERLLNLVSHKNYDASIERSQHDSILSQNENFCQSFVFPAGPQDGFRKAHPACHSRLRARGVPCADIGVMRASGRF